jgi:hypothetical protein
VTPAHLTAVLTHLTCLQLLTIDMRMERSMQTAAAAPVGSCVGHSGDCKGIAALLQATGSLQQLGSVQLWLPVALDHATVQKLNGMLGQLLHGSLATCCDVRTHLLSIQA